MRVHEIAKKLGMESRLLIPELVRLGIQVSSHSNTVDDDAAQWAMDVLLGKTAESESKPRETAVSGNIGVKTSDGRSINEKRFVLP